MWSRITNDMYLFARKCFAFPVYVKRNAKKQNHGVFTQQETTIEYPYGAKHSLLELKFKKSRGPLASIVTTPFHQDSYCQIESESRILDIN